MQVGGSGWLITDDGVQVSGSGWLITDDGVQESLALLTSENFTLCFFFLGLFVPGIVCVHVVDAIAFD